MFRFLILAAFIPALVMAQTPVSACTGGAARPLPIQVRVPGCTSSPCSVSSGSTINAQIDFIAPQGAITLRPYVWLTIGGQHMAYQVPPAQQNACNFLTGASCPLGVGQSATYNFQFSVTPGAAGPASIEVSLINQASATVWCAVLNVFIN